MEPKAYCRTTTRCSSPVPPPAATYDGPPDAPPTLAVSADHTLANLRQSLATIDTIESQMYGPAPGAAGEPLKSHSGLDGQLLEAAALSAELSVRLCRLSQRIGGV